MPTRPPTFGEKAVGLSFNPSQDPQVTSVKAACAAIIDMLDETRKTSSADKARILSVAITELQTAQMWMVKAITWQD